MLSLFSKDSQLGSDASFAGFGATFEGDWIQGRYPPGWQELGITVLGVLFYTSFDFYVGKPIRKH
jgi:hypothetical protein